jgi:IrrE N-terminal-like domain
VRWVRDTTGRFGRRPHYEPAELDRECEAVVARFLVERHGAVAYPISTDDLAVLVERQTADLDLYADLRELGAGVEAVTEFAAGRRPRVRVDQALAGQPRRERRLRTTLAHELGHVLFHNFLWFLETPAGARGYAPTCRGTDWMEWQAGYAGGALLLPAGAVRELVGAAPRVWARSAAAGALIRRVQAGFDVSSEAARVRLLQLGQLSERPPLVARAPLPRGLGRAARPPVLR